MFKLINGIFYSEHDLDLDHETILQEVIDSRNKPQPSNHNSRPHQHEVLDKHHTFYEDTNLYDKTYNTINKAVSNVVDGIFGKDMMYADEIWGHIIPPGEQTMLHNHGDIFKVEVGLSWVYYPHAVEKAGDLCFVSNINGNEYFYKTQHTKAKLFMFSNYIYHFTPRNASKIDRISISGNHFAENKLRNVLAEDVKCENPYWKYSGRM
tara:strand:- start:1875 stop:2498 length:624 start_codon:yes stop_codon:yes gene_type:complete